MNESLEDVFGRLVTANPPERPRMLFGTACVLGGSIAGLLAARVLADHAERVVVIDRDPIGNDTGVRAGVPQGRQVHLLPPGGFLWLVPFSWQNTRLLSCQASPAALRSLACLASCVVSAAIARFGSFSERFDFGVLVSPLC